MFVVVEINKLLGFSNHYRLVSLHMRPNRATTGVIHHMKYENHKCQKFDNQEVINSEQCQLFDNLKSSSL